MKPEYKTIAWLFTRWSTDDLLLWREADIDARQKQVNQVAGENQAVYEAAKVQLTAAREVYRQMYPRRDLTTELKYPVQRPPDIAGQWQKLINRRDKRLRDMSWDTEEKRAALVERFSEGRYQAMQRRETAIRQRVNKLAKEHGIQLSSRPIDERLDELLVALKLMGGG
jgi:hypothetical protein